MRVAPVLAVVLAPRTAPRRRYSPPAATARRAASYDDDDDGETYEAAWRRRRVATLKAAPELSVDEVQDLFEPDYLQKRLYERSPESAFGAVFRLEGVVADVEVLPAFVDAWTAVAAEFDYAPPSARDVDDVLRAGVRSEVAVDSVFRWTRDWGAARAAADRYGELVAELGDELEPAPRAGVEPWLRDLRSGNVPCCAVSRLPRKLLDACLGRLNLTDYFDGRVVCAEDDRDRAQQAFLHAAVELGRQPSRVVVFSDSVDDLIAAHEAEMRAVGVVGAHPAYELRVADLVVRDLDELRLANVRKLFADVDFDPLPELEVLLETEAPPVDTLYEDLDDDYDDDGPDFFS